MRPRVHVERWLERVIIPEELARVADLHRIVVVLRRLFVVELIGRDRISEAFFNTLDKIRSDDQCEAGHDHKRQPVIALPEQTLRDDESGEQRQTNEYSVVPRRL